MTIQQTPTSYRELVAETTPPPKPPPDPEQELDTLLHRMKERERKAAAEGNRKEEVDPVTRLRDQMVKQFIPVFLELAEKYSEAGIALDLDASNLLQGGREIKMELALAGHRIQLHGTATSEMIAFHETRHTPDFSGELAGGPMLRLRTLDTKAFRDFVCGRLSRLVHQVMRRR